MSVTRANVDGAVHLDRRSTTVSSVADAPQVAKPTRNASATTSRPIIVFGVFIGLWYFMLYWALEHICDKPSFLITAPHKVIRRRFFDRSIATALLSRARTGRPGRRVHRACVISIVLGMTLAIMMSQARGSSGRLAVPRRRCRRSRSWPSCRSSASIFGFDIHSRIFVCVHHLDLPDRVEHAVRPAVGRPRPARPVHPARRVALDAAAQAAAPRRDADDLHRVPHRRRPLGDRRRRRRAVLPARRQGHRDPAWTRTDRELQYPQMYGALIWRRPSASPSSSSSAGSATRRRTMARIHPQERLTVASGTHTNHQREHSNTKGEQMHDVEHAR